MSTKNDVRILVDYISFTIGRECLVESINNPDMEDETDNGILTTLCLILGTGELEFTKRKGFNGYDLTYFKGGISLCMGGRDDIMVQMSGQGCRLYETINRKLEWPELIRTVQRFQRHNFSRMDIAFDTFDLLEMGKIGSYTLEQRYISRFNDWLVSIGNKERSVIFGSPQSRLRLRIYDKTLERARVLGTTENVPENWVRLEFQMRDDAADSFIATWQRTGNVSTAYFGIMANQLRFVKKRESNLPRSVTVPWWERFLGNADKIPMAYKGGLEYNLQTLQKYLFGQAGSSIRAWLEISGNDPVKLAEMVQNKKLNEKQKHLLELEAMLTGQHVPSK